MYLTKTERALLDGLHGALTQAEVYASKLRSTLIEYATKNDISGVYSDLMDEIEDMAERLKAYKERLEEL